MSAPRCGPSRQWRRRWRAERQGRAAAIDFRAFRSTAAPSRRAKRSSPFTATAATAMNSSPRRSRPRPALAVVAADRRGQFPERCAAAGRARRARGLARSRRRGARAHRGQGDRRHRLGRQDRHQGSAAARAVEGRRDPRLGRLLQQSLGRAAVARALPGERALCGARNGHESRRRDRAAVAAGAPACGDHHHDRAGASRILRLARPRSPTPRPRSFSGSSPAAPRSSTATLRNSPI